MVTKMQCEAARYGDEFHYTGRHDCTRKVGLRGGITENVTRVRVSGKCQTWKRDPERFRLPVKHGMYEAGEITNHDAGSWHAPVDCPLVQLSLGHRENPTLAVVGNPGASSNVLEVYQAMARVFGMAWHRLSSAAMLALADDVAELAEELEPDQSQAVDFDDAAVELRRRIGGAKALGSYAASLLAGRRRSNPVRPIRYRISAVVHGRRAWLSETATMTDQPGRAQEFKHRDIAQDSADILNERPPEGTTGRWGVERITIDPVRDNPGQAAGDTIFGRAVHSIKYDHVTEGPRVHTFKAGDEPRMAATASGDVRIFHPRHRVADNLPD